MKKHFYLLPVWIIAFPLVIFSQPSVVWDVAYGGSYTDYAADIIVVQDSNFLVLSMPYSIDGDVSDSHGGADFWLIKLDNAGQVIWKKAYGGPADEAASKIIPTNDGGYFLLGTTDSQDGDVTSNYGASDVWLIKISEDGEISWQKTYGGTAADRGNSIAATSDGNFMIVGSTHSLDYDLFSAGNHGSEDLWAFKINPDGEILWSKCYGGSNDDWAASIIPTSDGGGIIAGGSRSTNADAINNHGLVDAFVLRLNTTGVIQWKKMFGNIGQDYNNDMVATDDGGAVLINTSNSPLQTNHGEYDIWGVRINSSGTILWQKCFGGTDQETGLGISKTSTGNFLFTGVARSINGDLVGNTNPNAWMFCVDSGGNLLWQKPYGGPESEKFNKAIEIADGEFVVIGTNSLDYGNLWVVRMSLLVTGSKDIATTLGQISITPNPAHDEIKILGTDFGENAFLTISAVDGSIVRKQSLNPDQQVPISDLPAGMYVVTLTGRNGIRAGTFVKQ